MPCPRCEGLVIAETENAEDFEVRCLNCGCRPLLLSRRDGWIPDCMSEEPRAEKRLAYMRDYMRLRERRLRGSQPWREGKRGRPPVSLSY
jgi:hypothetical protein